MACTSSCRTQDHASWGACVRAKNLRTNALAGDNLDNQRAADKGLDAYAKARASGIQPKTTRAIDVQRAVRFSDTTGVPFQA
jgi:hypothetical protein